MNVEEPQQMRVCTNDVTATGNETSQFKVRYKSVDYDLWLVSALWTKKGGHFRLIIIRPHLSGYYEEIMEVLVN